MMQKIKVIIMGAAGRDFHNFNVYFRNNDAYEVVAFTATQIPGIEGRRYPTKLAGCNYPKGILILPEEDLPRLIKEHDIDQVIFAYSDVSHEYVMHKASLVLASGADYRLMGPKTTMLKSKVPIVSVCAVRTGSGKSQTSRTVAKILKSKGLKVVAIRHPMPYGDLREQVWQRFASYEDLDKHKCTIEEREEYEPHIDNGIIVYAGVDYEKVRMADVVIINKVDTADPRKVTQVRENIKLINPKARILDAASPVTADNPELIRGKRVLVIEDGPTLTHGNMPYGAGTIMAQNAGAKEIVDPKPYAVGSIQEAYKKYSHLGAILPALGYSDKQVAELKETIERIPCDVIAIGTPIDLRRIITLNKPTVRVRYELKVLGPVSLEQVIDEFLKRCGK